MYLCFHGCIRSLLMALWLHQSCVLCIHQPGSPSCSMHRVFMQHAWWTCCLFMSFCIWVLVHLDCMLHVFTLVCSDKIVIDFPMRHRTYDLNLMEDTMCNRFLGMPWIWGRQVSWGEKRQKRVLFVIFNAGVPSLIILIDLSLSSGIRVSYDF